MYYIYVYIYTLVPETLDAPHVLPLTEVVAATGHQHDHSRKARGQRRRERRQGPRARGQKGYDIALRKIIRGPMRWIVPNDLRMLNRELGFPVEIRSMGEISSAAMTRVSWHEGKKEGGMQPERRAEDLDKWTRDSSLDIVERVSGWNKWFQKGQT